MLISKVFHIWEPFKEKAGWPEGRFATCSFTVATWWTSSSDFENLHRASAAKLSNRFKKKKKNITKLSELSRLCCFSVW